MTSDLPNDPGADVPAAATDDIAPGGVAPDGSTALSAEADQTASSMLPPPSLDDVSQPDEGESDEDASDGFPRSSAAGPDSPTLVAVSFSQRLKAQEFLLAMGRLRAEGDLDLQDAVIVDKGDDGKTRVTETIDPSPGRSAMSGAVWTGLLGLFLGGPVGWLAGLGIGAGAGAVTAKVVDLGVPDEWVDWFKQAVRPSSSTVVLLLDDINMPALLTEAERFAGAELLHSTMQGVSFDDLADAFEPHRRST